MTGSGHHGDGGDGVRAALRRLRLAAGLTQERLAERAGVSAKAIIALENDPARTPRLETVTRAGRRPGPRPGRPSPPAGGGAAGQAGISRAPADGAGAAPGGRPRRVLAELEPTPWRGGPRAEPPHDPRPSPQRPVARTGARPGRRGAARPGAGAGDAQALGRGGPLPPGGDRRDGRRRQDGAGGPAGARAGPGLRGGVLAQPAQRPALPRVAGRGDPVPVRPAGAARPRARRRGSGSCWSCCGAAEPGGPRQLRDGARAARRRWATERGTRGTGSCCSGSGRPGTRAA